MWSELFESWLDLAVEVVGHLGLGILWLLIPCTWHTTTIPMSQFLAMGEFPKTRAAEYEPNNSFNSQKLSCA